MRGAELTMTKPQTTAAYGVIERDLANVAAERVETAIFSVMQLSEDPQTKFIIAIHAMTTAIGIATGVYRALNDEPEADTYELAKYILDLACRHATEEKEQGE